MSRAAVVAILVMLSAAHAVGAQEFTPMTMLPAILWRVELGAAASTPLIEDGNGVTVRRGVGPVLGVDAGIDIGARSGANILLRIASAPLRARSATGAWSPGSSRQVDLGVSLGHLGPAMTVVSLGVSATHLRGPRDVIPFRAGAINSWSAEAALSRRLLPERALQLVLAGDLLRMPGGGTEDPPVRAGWVGRGRLALRHVF